MKAFRFSLTAVREVRQSEEQAAQKTYADAIRACDEVAVRLVILDRDLQNVWQGLRNSSLEGMRADQMRHARSWCVVLEEKQKQLTAELDACQRHVDTTQRLLKAATQRRETIDRLLRKQLRAHEREVQQEDQKFLDELATRGAWRGAAQMETA
jgi:flagellar export protein FliJ